mmetsp:Transcript_31028/g.31521  ORF Transcript_31028/g.31521 Transcript_31028/m.31521 type:complete len:203 (-) Transcript_31028:375-983(-)
MNFRVICRIEFNWVNIKKVILYQELRHHLKWNRLIQDHPPEVLRIPPPKKRPAHPRTHHPRRHPLLLIRMHPLPLIRMHPLPLTLLHPLPLIRRHPLPLIRRHPLLLIRMHPLLLIRMHPLLLIRRHPLPPIRMHPLTLIRMYPLSPILMHPQQQRNLPLHWTKEQSEQSKPTSATTSRKDEGGTSTAMEAKNSFYSLCGVS